MSAFLRYCVFKSVNRSSKQIANQKSIPTVPQKESVNLGLKLRIWGLQAVSKPPPLQFYHRTYEWSDSNRVNKSFIFHICQVTGSISHLDWHNHRPLLFCFMKTSIKINGHLCHADPTCKYLHILHIAHFLSNEWFICTAGV